jgi:hypothetical protein
MFSDNIRRPSAVLSACLKSHQVAPGGSAQALCCILVSLWSWNCENYPWVAAPVRDWIGILWVRVRLGELRIGGGWAVVYQRVRRGPMARASNPRASYVSQYKFELIIGLRPGTIPPHLHLSNFSHIRLQLFAKLMALTIIL